MYRLAVFFLALSLFSAAALALIGRADPVVWVVANATGLAMGWALGFAQAKDSGRV